jgi:hypothetical protein
VKSQERFVFIFLKIENFQKNKNKPPLPVTACAANKQASTLFHVLD